MNTSTIQVLASNAPVDVQIRHTVDRNANERILRHVMPKDLLVEKGVGFV
jgi:hypothetical protein